MVAERVREVASITEMHGKGDYCFAGDKVLLSCPVCAGVMSLSHTVESRNPLTLAPSVQGPPEARESHAQVLGPCGHHFWIRDGRVIDPR